MSDNCFKCPACGSDNIQSYEAIYNGGRATQTSTTDGISVGSDWSVGHANTSGSSITHLAKTCAPPVREVYRGYGVFSFYLFLAIVAGAALFAIHPIASVIVIVFPLYKWAKKVNRVNAERNLKFIKLYKQWQHFYYCHRCGNRFIIEEE